MSAPTSPADILRAARAKIDVPEKWTQDWYSRDQNGGWVDLRSAYCFCTTGALAYASGEVDAQGFEESDIAHLFETAIDGEYIVTWNDAKDRTHAEVMAAFDRAIALAEQTTS